MNFLHKNLLTNLPPIALGLFGFLLVVGLAPLDPANINWFKGWDALENYIGWVFYRYDSWHFPIGLNPKNGLEIGTSIVYSDSIPLAAIFFKLIGPFLGEPFQYFGIWYLICFLFQAWFSWLLVGLFLNDWWTRVFAVGFYIFAPPFMYKMGMTEMVGTHPAPASHFLLICAIFLVFKKNYASRIWQWPLLLAISCLINFYLFAMVFIVWAGNALDVMISRQHWRAKKEYFEILLVFCAIFFVAWQGGYFIKNTGAIGDYSYGFFRMSVLSIFDSRGWSYILNSLPQATDLDEVFHVSREVGLVHGFQYLGMGALIIFCIAMMAFIRSSVTRAVFSRNLKRHYFLFGTLIFLTVFAVSNNISFGSYNIHIELPDSIIYSAGILRSSGRMFWPVFYIILVLILYICARALSKNALRLLFAICLVVQILDTSAGWIPIHQKLARDSRISETSAFADPIWDGLALQYSKFLSYPLRHHMYQYNWEHIARFASRKKIATNAVYLARPDQGKIDRANQLFVERLIAGKLDPQAVYILDDSMLIPIMMYANLHTDLLAIIPNFLTFIPNRSDCIACEGIPDSWVVHYSNQKIRLDSTVLFNSSNQYLIPMLAGGHEWIRSKAGVLIPSNEAKLVLPLPKQGQQELELFLDCLEKGQEKPAVLQISVEGGLAETHTLNCALQNPKITVGIPNSASKNGFIRISLKHLTDSSARPPRLVSAHFH